MKQKNIKNTQQDKDSSMSQQIDKWMEIADSKHADTLQAILDEGGYYVYVDEQGRTLKKYSDGTVEVIREAEK